MSTAWTRLALAALACVIALPASAQLPGVDEPCVNAGIDKVKDQLQ